LGAIAGELAAAGQYNKALEVAETLKDNYEDKQRALEAIARGLAKAERYDQAIEIAKTIYDFPVKARALDAIVSKLAEKGQYDRALQVAETIQSYYGGKDKMREAIARYRKSP
jgi:tetratricopeptide (TPR) repeat protein